MPTEYLIARALANILDNQFGWGKFRFGFDAILDLLPFGGDTIILILSFYLVWAVYKIGVPGSKIQQMIATILISYAIGLIPVLGDIAYLTLKPNMRNLAILEEYLSDHRLEGRD